MAGLMAAEEEQGLPAELSRFVPIQRQELVELLKGELDSDPASREQFSRFAGLLQHTLHFEFNQQMEQLRRSYRPFDPDPVAASVLEVEAPSDSKPFLEALTQVLEQANFRQITEAELDEAFNTHTLFPLSVKVDLEEFEDLLLFRRGESKRTERVRGLSTLYRWKEVEVELFNRLVLALRLNPQAIKHHKGAHRVKDMKLGKIYLKFFKNIPKADLEMVFPNTRLKMNIFDRLKVSTPLVGGLLTAGLKLAALAGLVAGAGVLTKTDERSLQAAGGLILVLVGYILRSFNGYKNTKIRYMKTITDGLYFRNLDNNIGVIHHLLSAAEEEEVKEALLAYFFLLRAEEPISQGELDHIIERWFATRFDRHFDFEVEDGLEKLKRLGLISGDKERLKVVGLDEALTKLDKLWDNYFDFAPPAPAGEG